MDRTSRKGGGEGRNRSPETEETNYYTWNG